MVICADVAENQDFLYTVTGQQHSGIIGFVQTLVSVNCFIKKVLLSQIFYRNFALLYGLKDQLLIRV